MSEGSGSNGSIWEGRVPSPALSPRHGGAHDDTEHIDAFKTLLDTLSEARLRPNGARCASGETCGLIRTWHKSHCCTLCKQRGVLGLFY